MSNQRRVVETPLIIREFNGANSAIDDLKGAPDSTNWQSGMFSHERHVCERVPGKLLHSTGSCGGHILTLQHCLFRDRGFVVIHQNTEYKVESDVSDLMDGIILVHVSPLTPVIFT